MLGIIFGVAAVISMMSIGAGARYQVMAFIEQLGLKNLIVEAHESLTYEDLQKVRKSSPGLSFHDFRIIRSNIPSIVEATARKKFEPSKIVPKPSGEIPVVYGVEPGYQKIANLRVTDGRFFDPSEEATAAPVAILGSGARAGLFSEQDPIGKYVKVNEQWLHVIRVVAPQLTAKVEGVDNQNSNNLIAVSAAERSLELAKLSLAAEQKKYELGAQTIFFVLDAQTQLAQAQQDLLSSQIEYRKALTELDRATGMLLDAYSVELYKTN